MGNRSEISEANCSKLFDTTTVMMTEACVLEVKITRPVHSVLSYVMNNLNSPDLLPARLSAGETARLLGFAEHDVPILVASKLLEPLGSPAANSPKYFAKISILEKSVDVKWLDRATRTISKYWIHKRSQRRTVIGPGSDV